MITEDEFINLLKQPKSHLGLWVDHEVVRQRENERIVSARAALKNTGSITRAAKVDEERPQIVKSAQQLHDEELSMIADAGEQGEK